MKISRQKSGKSAGKRDIMDFRQLQPKLAIGYKWTILSAFFCILSGAGAWIISTIIPFANLSQSFFYYFLPLFAMPVIGTALIYPRKAEFAK